MCHRYVDQAALDAHMQTYDVKDLIHWMTAEDVLDGPPAIHQLQFLEALDFARPEVTSHSDPYVIYATLDYVSEGASESLPYWKQVVDTGRELESGTLIYGICRDNDRKDRLCTVEAYESKAYLDDVHVKSDAIAESIKKTKHLRTGLKHTLLKIQAGYLYKEREV